MKPWEPFMANILQFLEPCWYKINFGSWNNTSNNITNNININNNENNNNNSLTNSEPLPKL